jgi:hypothetical protein
MNNDPGDELTPADLNDLKRLVGIMAPPNAGYCVPGADDAVNRGAILVHGNG